MIDTRQSEDVEGLHSLLQQFCGTFMRKVFGITGAWHE